MISKETARSFKWREICEGWTLLDAADLSVIQERMPPGTSELLHVHAGVTQLYFVLDGEAAVDLDDRSEKLRSGEALIIAPSVPHRIRNPSQRPLEFLVISSSRPRLDRENLE